jgi:hypothetical protein
MPAFSPDRLAAIDAALEVEIETRRGPGSPSHRVVIWVVIEGDEVFVRSVRGSRGRWYRELMQNPKAVIHVHGAAVAVRGTVVDDDPSVERCSRALRTKYAGDPALRSMLRAEVLPTTIRLEPG